jgi:hypothetical protein
MFEKLVSILPYNPGAIQQLGFYGRRMRQESSVRRIGLAFVVLAFMVQFIAVLSPPQSTGADPSNDLVAGGIRNNSQAGTDCTGNVNHYGDILKYYGISCSSVASAPTVSLKSTDYNKTLYSAGHLPYAKAGETTVNVTYASGGSGPLYWRFLWSWDTYAFSTYSALSVKSSTGATYFILYNCGNLVSIGLPKAPVVPTPVVTPKPAPVVTPVVTPVTPVVTPKPTPTPTPTPVDVCPDVAGIQTSTDECTPCQEALSSEDTIACLQFSKTASDPTQNISNADGATAHAGDTIIYNLYAKNSGTTKVSQFVIQENMSDVLDYATITDFHGGSIDSNNILSWPAQDISPGATATQQITVQVKNPIPQTTPSASNPGDYDLTMTNVYGNTVNIHLPQTIVAAAQQLTTTLPNTGPGTGLFISAGVTLIVGYFFARSRLLVRETSLAMQDTTISGGL